MKIHWKPKAPAWILGTVGTTMTLLSLLGIVPSSLERWTLLLGCLLVGILIGNLTERFLIRSEYSSYLDLIIWSRKDKPIVTFKQLGRPKPSEGDINIMVKGLGIVVMSKEAIKAAWEHKGKIAFELEDMSSIGDSVRTYIVTRFIPH